MALGERYKLYANHQFGGDNRFVKLYQEGYTGAVEDIKGGKTPVTLQWNSSDANVFDSIIGTEVVLSLMSLTDAQFIEFAESKNKEWLIRVYVNTTVVEWQGWLIPEEYEQLYTHAPFPIILRFTCGLGSLASISYLDDGEYFTGRIKESVIISNVLSNLDPASPLTSNFYASISLVPTSASVSLEHTALNLCYTDQNKYINTDGSTWDCLSVLRDILKPYGCRIVRGSGGWWITRIRDYALLIDGKLLTWVVYPVSTGVAGGYGSFSPTTVIIEYTGPTGDRSEDICWIGGNQRIRYERAYKEIDITFKYNYSNMLQNGSFIRELGSFWIVTTGTVSLVQDTNDADVQNLYMDAPSTDAHLVSQTINHVEAGSADQVLIFKAEVMIEGPETINTIWARFSIYLNADAGPARDRWLDGHIATTGPSVAIHWKTTAAYVEWYYSTNINQWQTVEIILPAIPYAGSLTVGLKDIFDFPDGDLTACRWKNISLLGTYNLLPPVKLEEINFPISINNLVTSDPIEITSGDIVDDGNEWAFCKNAKSRDATGATSTSTWRSYYGPGTRTAIGPLQSLITYLRDGLIMQHGVTRRRLAGTLAMDSYKLAYSLIKEHDKYFLPTMINQKSHSGEIEISMIEIAPIADVIIDENLIANWEIALNWDVWTVTVDPLIDTLAELSGDSASSESDAIEVIAYEQLRVQVTGNFDEFWPPSLEIGTWNSELSDGMDLLIIPSTGGGMVTPIVSNESPGADTESTNVLIKVTRVYGY